MKYCPVCDERFDEDIIKFCTKDGTPLVEDAAPKFTEMPSEALDDDFGQETVIRRRPEPSEQSGQSERIVIPTTHEPEQQVRPRSAQAYYPPPPPPNTAKTIILTIIGTLAVLGFGAGLFWLLRSEPAANMNVNTDPPNINTNLNTNLGFDSNFNFNTNANFDTNFNAVTNLNTNVRTPTPTSTPTPRPSPSPTATPRTTPDDDTPEPTPRPATPRPTNTATPAGTPRMGPRPPANAANRPGNGN
ncbi:MAG: hypothetical protein AB7J13_06730 [Pyrinomonadaceae bacterium]